MKKLNLFSISFLIWMASLCALPPLTAIEYVQNSFIQDASLELQHEKAIDSFLKGNYEDALSDFNDVLQKSSLDSPSEINLCGSALWGRALCYACLDRNEEAHQDLNLLQAYFPVPCSHDSIEKAQHFIVPVVKYANPDEKIFPPECKDRVRGIVYKIKELLATRLRRGSDNYSEFASRINDMAARAITCCEKCDNASAIWTSCLTPLMEKYEKWRDNGIPPNPYWE